MASLSSQRESSSNVSTTSTASAFSGRSASPFFAAHGPINTTRVRAPRRALIMRPWTTMGEATGSSCGVSSGLYFSI